MGEALGFIKMRHVRSWRCTSVARALGTDLGQALTSKQDDSMKGNPLVSLPV